jgi:hypothetical protein
MKVAPARFGSQGTMFDEATTRKRARSVKPSAAVQRAKEEVRLLRPTVGGQRGFGNQAMPMRRTTSVPAVRSLLESLRVRLGKAKGRGR